MIICKYGCYAYVGETAAEAYDRYIGAQEDNSIVVPDCMEWFSATPMTLVMKLEPKAVKK